MKPSLAAPLPWGLLTAKLKKECSHQCEGCGAPEMPISGRPLRLHFKDGQVNNRLRSNLLMLCPKCIHKALAARRRGRKINLYQLSMELDP